MTYYVDNRVGSGGDGRSWATAFESVNHAIRACNPDDRVLAANPVTERGIDMRPDITVEGMDEN